MRFHDRLILGKMLVKATLAQLGFYNGSQLHSKNIGFLEVFRLGGCLYSA